MNGTARFPYVRMGHGTGPAGMMPVLPVSLQRGKKVVVDAALIDSGAAVNVLPYQLGLELGGDWDEIQSSFSLGGVFSDVVGKPLIASVQVAQFPPFQMAFAWTQSTRARLIFGQFHFFQLFDVCFFGANQEFQVQPRTP